MAALALFAAACAAQYDVEPPGRAYRLGTVHAALVQRAESIWAERFACPCDVADLRYRELGVVELAEACEVPQATFGGCTKIEHGQPVEVLVEEIKQGRELELLIGHELGHACAAWCGFPNNGDGGHRVDMIWRGPGSYADQMVNVSAYNVEAL